MPTKTGSSSTEKSIHIKIENSPKHKYRKLQPQKRFIVQEILYVLWL